MSLNLGIFLWVIPLLALISGLFVYRFQGKRDLLQLDIVQFMYTYIFAPLLFIWLKTFLFTLLRQEIGGSLSVAELFTIDTGFSLAFLYLYSFIVMHSLTKTFNLKSHDPLYDLFRHSEYIHLWMTHLATFVGAMGFVVVLALLNLFFPLQLEISRATFWLIIFASIALGVVFYVSMLMADPKQQKRITFTRLMKLVIGGYFSLQVAAYFLFDPPLQPAYMFYWFSLMIFGGAFGCALFSNRSRRASSLFERVVDKMVHLFWGKNMQLFGK